MLGGGHEQPPNPQPSELRADRNVGDIKQSVERLQEHEAGQFAAKFSYDGFAYREPLGRDGRSFGCSDENPS